MSPPQVEKAFLWVRWCPLVPVQEIASEGPGQGPRTWPEGPKTWPGSVTGTGWRKLELKAWVKDLGPGPGDPGPGMGQGLGPGPGYHSHVCYGVLRRTKTQQSYVFLES